MQPKLSIIVPCYNLGSYLEEAIGSIVYKNPYDLELIIVNDGSDDPFTLKILKEQENKGVKVYHQENKGPGAARNRGIRLSKGRYILPLDADNKLRPKFLDRALKIFEEEPEVDIIYGDAQFFGEKEGRWEVGSFDFSKILYSNYIDTCACFRKEVWEENGGYDEKRLLLGSEDWDFWLRAYINGFQFKYVEEIFFDYRVRKNSLVNTARLQGAEIVEYIFSKPELKHLKEVRREIEKLQRSLSMKPTEPALLDILKILIKKIKRRVKVERIKK